MTHEQHIAPTCVKGIVGLLGKKHSGKDTIFDTMLQLWNERVIEWRPVRFAFADLLKHEVAEKLELSIDELNKRKNEPLIRSTLQSYGSDKRAGNPLYWINALHAELGAKESYPKTSGNHFIAVITDVRHFNEADYIRSIKGPLVKKIVRIYRKSADEVEDNHESEVNVTRIPFDVSISNDASLLLLKNHVKYMLADMGVK